MPRVNDSEPEIYTEAATAKRKNALKTTQQLRYTER